MSGVTTAAVVTAGVTGAVGAGVTMAGNALMGGGSSKGGGGSSQMSVGTTPMGNNTAASGSEKMQSSKVVTADSVKINAVPTQPFSGNAMGIGDDVWANRLSALLNNGRN